MNNFGIRLKEWRSNRKLSQMDLALDAGISTKHLSNLETGKAAPSREMVDILSLALEIPLREKNDLLTAAGFSASYEARDLNDLSMWAAKEAIQKILDAHAPYPALAVDRHWNLIMANVAAMDLMKVVDAELLSPPVNVLRLSLHPKGLAPFIVNFGQWKRHLIERLEHDLKKTQDKKIMELIVDLSGYGEDSSFEKSDEIAVPFILNMGGKKLSFISTTTVFGSANDVTVSEIALEMFFPLDEETKKVLNS